MNDFLTLAIETSCDETSVAIIRNDTEILSNEIFSQIEIHKKFGGVVPEIASRNHLQKINDLITKSLEVASANCEYRITLHDINLVSVANGPGLIGALLIGLSTAKALSLSLGIPIVYVNHIKSHLLINLAEHKTLEPPFLGLIISGGHTVLTEVDKDFRFTLLGETRDDALGEAFDKVARVLGFPYPGAPVLETYAQSGDPTAFPFKRSLIDEDNLDFSFSGIKSNVINVLNKLKQEKKAPDIKTLLSNNPQLVNDISASFQTAVTDILILKTQKAIARTNLRTLVVGGGVASNSYIKKRLSEELSDTKICVPSKTYCTDNAAMIGIMGKIKYDYQKITDGLDVDAYSRMDF